MIQAIDTQTQLFVKGTDYGSEEYIKQLLTESDRKKLLALYPYVGVISYPSDDFLNRNLALEQTRQFAAMTYVGHLEFLLPVPTSEHSGQMSISIVSFNLDGKPRQFMQVCQPNQTDTVGNKFIDFALTLYPNANHHLPFNRHALHILKDISVTGAAYQVKVDGGFQAQPGAFTPTVEFEVSVSGYEAQQQ
ncbi:hypothetical protein [Mucilaginibacter sp.]